MVIISADFCTWDRDCQMMDIRPGQGPGVIDDATPATHRPHSGGQANRQPRNSSFLVTFATKITSKQGTSTPPVRNAFGDSIRRPSSPERGSSCKN